MRREDRKSTQGLSDQFNPKHRFIFIGLCVLLMASLVLITGKSLRESGREAQMPLPSAGDQSSIPLEAGVFQLSTEALNYRDSPDNTIGSRSLSIFYSRRAFPGAPPYIPHPVKTESTIGANICLQCHENGGYVPKFKAYAPVVPHPELVSCLQCHVPATTANVFKSNNWQTTQPPEINREAFSDAPPPIPHGLQMRQNCLACHAGPGAVKEIRVMHPERVNCRQCHAATTENAVWVR